MRRSRKPLHYISSILGPRRRLRSPEPKVAILQGKIWAGRVIRAERPRSAQVNENQLLEIFDPCAIPARPFYSHSKLLSRASSWGHKSVLAQRVAERSADSADECLELRRVAGHMVGKLVRPAGLVLRKSLLKPRREEARVKLPMLRLAFEQRPDEARVQTADDEQLVYVVEVAALQALDDTAQLLGRGLFKRVCETVMLCLVAVATEDGAASRVLDELVIG
jgi:hypothetical protein